MQEGDQPIHIAAAHGHSNVVQTLIKEYCVDPFSTAKNGLLPIHHAAQEGQEEVVKLLVDKFNTNVNVTSNVSK